MFSNIFEDKEDAQFDLGPAATALDLLQAVYRDPGQELHTRIRCAMACLPFQTPKLAVVAQITEQDIASVLDRRIAHYQRLQSQIKLIEAKPTKLEQSEQPEPKPKPTPAPLNRLYNNKLWRRF